MKRSTILVITALIGCQDTPTPDPADTRAWGYPPAHIEGERPPPGPTVIDSIQDPGCAANQIDWEYRAYTIEWTNGLNIVNAWETGAPRPHQWNEEHTLPSVNYGPGWDELERILTAGAQFDDYMPDVNTLVRPALTKMFVVVQDIYRHAHVAGLLIVKTNSIRNGDVTAVNLSF